MQIVYNRTTTAATNKQNRIKQGKMTRLKQFYRKMMKKKTEIKDIHTHTSNEPHINTIQMYFGVR